MIDLVMAGRNFDFSFQFAENAFQQVSYFVRQCLQSNDRNIASKYAKIEKSLNKNLTKNLYPIYGIEG